MGPEAVRETIGQVYRAVPLLLMNRQADG